MKELFLDDIEKSLDVLRQGGIILYPTDTIWGLGCDATNNEAVKSIFDIKGRDSNRSLIVLVDGIPMLERYVREVPEMAYQLIEVSDKPLTIIYPEGKMFANGVCAADKSIGIRVCNDPFCQELIYRFRKPIVSTSANFSGQSSPINFDGICRELIERVDYTVNFRRSDKMAQTASSIIKINSDNSFKIVR